tara:strand:- start:77377 stop:77565 length:189 start_codon:yes stop_codon:yes gene_type:complete
MSINRPSSNKKPGEQSSQTPSGKEVPMAMSMMVDSMVRMIQKANDQNIEANHDSSKTNINEY